MSKKEKKSGPSGWLVINKSAGVSSFAATNAARRLTGAAKAGHGGTLDPFAEGVLPVALGEATKTLAVALNGDKKYRCWIRFGRETDTGDREGAVTAENDRRPDAETLAQALPHFCGKIEQVPPVYSALHIAGERAYARARRGEEVVMPARTVTIHHLELKSCTDGLAVLDVHCGKGTYMRALARDLARHVGALGHLERLLRTESLGFTMQEGVSLDQLAERVAAGHLHTLLLPVDRVLDDIPVLRLSADAWRRIQNGQAVRVAADHLPAGPVRLLTPEGTFAAIGTLDAVTADANERLCRPQRLFQTASPDSTAPKA
ncbi:MAG: tRNA pseudouridine(55) synthase TruB [Magnetococcales bacterium]|nr:tRNA pseudouridine(55) synthase TruB [Magnetococcales bacterium]